MHHNFYQSLQVGISTRVAIVIGIGGLITALRTAILAKNNQKRNERFLAYQFKLGQLDKRGEKIEKASEKLKQKLSEPLNMDMSFGTDSLNILRSTLKNKESYLKVYEKMKKEFGLDDI